MQGYRPEEAVVFIRSASTVVPPMRSSNAWDLARWAPASTVGRKTMMNILNKLKGNKSGASAAEYALIVAVLGGFVVAGSVAFGGSLKTAMTSSGTQLTTEQAKAR